MEIKKPKIIKYNLRWKVWRWKLYGAEISWRNWQEYAIVTKNLKKEVSWVVGMVMDSFGNIGVLEIYRWGVDDIIYEFPRGSVEDNDFNCKYRAVLEIKEEFWIQKKIFEEKCFRWNSN